MQIHQLPRPGPGLAGKPPTGEGAVSVGVVVHEGLLATGVGEEEGRIVDDGEGGHGLNYLAGSLANRVEANCLYNDDG